MGSSLRVDSDGQDLIPGKIQERALKFIGAQGVPISAGPLSDTIRKIIKQSSFGKAGECSKVKIGGFVNCFPGINGKALGCSILQVYFLLKFVAAVGKGIKGELGVNPDLALPIVSIFLATARSQKRVRELGS